MEKVRIRLENISKSYYSQTSVTQALRKINLTFSMGEFVAITGESGSGKSTLLNIIGGMDTFDDGEMYVDGEATFQYDEEDWEEYRRSKIGYVFQDYSLVGHYTVLDNMLCGLLIRGNEKEQSVRIAKEYLEQVGLSGYEYHKASELSSGQKQRLSIARALAKDTGIIVADEPTGNLDRETGTQIIALLKKLSRERLVIMVTHNYDQAEAYVTRKIRIHDGEIVSDVAVNTTEEVPAIPREKAENGKKRRHDNRVAAYFAKKNCVTGIGRSLLFTTFFVIVGMVSFLLIGEIAMHADDRSTKEYDTAAFYREDNTRLVVRREDGLELTEDDLEKIADISYVEIVDSCDYANDINFYIEENRDYKYLFGVQRGKSKEEVKKVSFLNEDHFMMSTDCVSEEDLAAGKMPEVRNEIVLYSEDESVVGTEVLCYFTANNIWDKDEYYQTTMVVSGVLKEETEQVYFAREMCEMLSMHMDSGVYRLYYAYDFSKGDYEQKPEVVPVINDELTGNEVRVSLKFSNPVVGEVLFHFENPVEGEKAGLETIEETVTVLEVAHGSTGDFMEVSREFFDTYYKAKKQQASVYISSYAKTQQVIKKLEKLGYEALSTYQISTTDYVENLVMERLRLLGICVGGLITLLLAEVLILRSLMKIRIKDCYVFKFMGMRMCMIEKVNYFEMLAYALMAIMITIALMWGLRMAGVPMIEEMMWYYDIGVYLFFAGYNLVLAVLTVAAFHRILKGRLQI